MPISEVFNEDNMLMMARYPDGFFDLGILDPPYGLNLKLTRGGGSHMKFKNDVRISEWDVLPSEDYFKEVFRVTKHQIIWGGNYFNLPPYRCPIIWDKVQVLPNFSQFELAWTSFDKPAKIFKIKQAGFIGEPKIHPCQKPVKLYSMCLGLAVQGWKVLDTHMGSQNSRVAAFKNGFDYWGVEADESYFNEGCENFKKQTKQIQLF